jgi:hypothetical protein
MATSQFGGLTSTSTTASQTINSFTPTSSTSWKSTMVVLYFTTYSSTSANGGVAKLQQNGSDIAEMRLQNTGNDSCPGIQVIPWGNGLQFSGSEVVQWITTPAASTSMRWTASFFGQG